MNLGLPEGEEDEVFVVLVCRVWNPFSNDMATVKGGLGLQSHPGSLRVQLRVDSLSHLS